MVRSRYGTVQNRITRSKEKYGPNCISTIDRILPVKRGPGFNSGSELRFLLFYPNLLWMLFLLNRALQLNIGYM
jgi:hypothetical protein